MVDRTSAAAPPPERPTPQVAAPQERATLEQLERAEVVEALKRADAPERMVVRLTMAENRAEGRTADRLAAGLRTVRDQLEALRQLVIAGRLEARVVPEAVSVALPDAVAQLDRTIRAVVAPEPPRSVQVSPPPRAPQAVAIAPAPLEVRPAPAPAPAPPAVDTGLVPLDLDTSLVTPTSIALAPADLDVALAPVSAETGLVPLDLDTSLVTPTSTALVPSDLDVALAPASVGTALLPVELGGLAPTGVPTTLAAIRSTALLVTNDPAVPVALATPPGDGVPVVLQHRPFEGVPTPTTLQVADAPPSSQALQVGEGNSLLRVDLADLAPERLGLQELAGAPTPQALQVVDDAIATVERVAADVGRVRQEVELAAERAVLDALPSEPVAVQAVATVVDEVRASIAMQAVAALMASVSGLDRRHAERLLIDAPAHAAAARRPAPAPILSMGAMAART